MATLSGAVYAFGRGQYGQLGVGDREPRFGPTRIEALRDVHVISVAAGRDHSLVLDIRGRLYTFGRNDAGQLGIDSKIDMHTPQLVFVKDRRTCDSADSNTISQVTCFKELSCAY